MEQRLLIAILTLLALLVSIIVIHLFNRFLKNKTAEIKKASDSDDLENQIKKVTKEGQDAILKQINELEGKEEERARQQVEKIGSLSNYLSSWAEIFVSSNKLGKFGEDQLEKYLKLNGFVEGVDFKKQESFISEDDEKKIPDYVVYLPGGGVVAIDCKAPLSEFRNAAEEEDVTEREQLFKKHAKKVRSRAVELAQDEYPKAILGNHLRSPNFVIMFLPHDVFYLKAVEEDSSLIEEALNKFGKQKGSPVILTSPGTLNAALSTIQLMWQEHKSLESVGQIRGLVTNMHSHLRTLITNIATIGNKIEDAGKAYNDSIKKYDDVKKSIDELEDTGLNQDQNVSKQPTSVKDTKLKRLQDD